MFEGTGVALVTPFTQENTVDYVALGNIIDSVIAGGVDFLVALGTTAETPTLTKAEKKQVLDFILDHNQDRLPVVVGIGDYSTQALLDTLAEYPMDRVSGILSVAPYYNKPSQEGIYQHYKALAAESPKPILLYNVPGRTGRNMTAETTLRLAQLPNIAGMKEASGDMAQCMQLLRDMPDDFLLVSGDDALALPLIACGMQGVISVAANAFPAEFSDMVRLCLKQDFAVAKPINDKLIEAYDLMFAENNPAGVKAFMAEKGWISNTVRLPVVPLSDGLHAKVKSYLGK